MKEQAAAEDNRLSKGALELQRDAALRRAERAERRAAEMPKSITMNVRVTDTRAFKEFLSTIGEVRDYCKGYDESQGNYGDVDLIGERLDDAIQDLYIEMKRSSERTGFGDENAERLLGREQPMFEIGDKVQVKPEHDIPPMFRPGGKPTTGEIREVYDGTYIVWVPIGDADIGAGPKVATSPRVNVLRPSRIDTEPSHPTTLSEWQDRANEAMAEVLRLQTLVGNIEKAMFHGGEWGGKALLVQHAAELHDDAKEARDVRAALDLAAPPGYAAGHVKELQRALAEANRRREDNIELIAGWKHRAESATSERKRAATLTDQWIAVYEDEQRHGSDHRRILSTLADIREALSGTETQTSQTVAVDSRAVASVPPESSHVHEWVTRKGDTTCQCGATLGEGDPDGSCTCHRHDCQWCSGG